MSAVAFLTRRRGGRGWHWTDVVTFGWLAAGLVLIFGPALWLLLSSFKTPAQLAEFPPLILPYASRSATVDTGDGPRLLPLYTVELPDGTTVAHVILNEPSPKTATADAAALIEWASTHAPELLDTVEHPAQEAWTETVVKPDALAALVESAVATEDGMRRSAAAFCTAATAAPMVAPGARLKLSVTDGN